jgi:hypothetical protein
MTILRVLIEYICVVIRRFQYIYIYNMMLKRNIILRLYLTLIRFIATYGAETWAATENEPQKLLIVEYKILRKIYGPVKNRDNWRIRTN